MTSRQMLLGMQFSGGYGAEAGAWRLPGANLFSYTDMDQFVRYAQTAERGKIQLLFIADTPVLDVDLDNQGVIRHRFVGSPGEKALDAAIDRLVEEAEGAGKSEKSDK